MFKHLFKNYAIVAFVCIFVNTLCASSDYPFDNYHLQIKEYLDAIVRDNQTLHGDEMKQNIDNIQEQHLSFHEFDKPEHEKKLKSVLYAILHDYQQELTVKLKKIIKKLRAQDCPSNLKPKKLLMVGPSGVGKTTIAKSLAVLAQRPYILIRAPQLLTRFQFSGAENITNIIKSILKWHKPYVIIIDEINCLFDRFESEHQPDKESGTALWLAIDECAERNDVFFIGIANNVKNMPPQLKTRFANHMLEIPLPDLYARKRIMRFYLKNIRHSLSNEMLNEIAEKTYGFSARELEDMMAKAIERAYDRNPTRVKIRFIDIENALYEIRPYGRIITAFKQIWDNKKEIAKEAGPYITVAGFGLNVVQTILNESNFLISHSLNKLGYELSKENYELSRTGQAIQEQSHALSKKTFDFQKKSHKESMLVQEKSHALQKSGNEMQKKSLEWQDFDHSLKGRLLNFFCNGAWLGLIK